MIIFLALLWALALGWATLGRRALTRSAQMTAEAAASE
jgi:hypothetical protein